MIKTRLFAAAAMAAMALSGQALAQPSPVTGQVDVNGSVADRCLFTSPSATITLGELAIQGSGSTAGFLNAPVVNAGTANLSGWCNGTAATMSVQATALSNTSFLTSPPTGFDRVINFTATATNGLASASDSSLTPGAGTAVPVGIFAASIPVSLSAASSPNSGRLIAGGYVGQVIVTLTPNTSLPQQPL